MVQIKSINVIQSSIVLSLVFFGMSIPIFLFTGLMGLLSGQFGMFLMSLFMPILYLVLGFVVNVIFCFIYNRVAERFGGIEIELEGTDSNLQ